MTNSLDAMLDSMDLVDDSIPFVRAIRRGARAPDLGEAFYEGYQAALTALVSPEVRDRRASLCVTERGGGHPRAMTCTIAIDGDHLVLDGEKSFVTGADRAELLYVVAREAEDAGTRPSLKLVRVPSDAPELTFHTLPATPFAPGISHARVSFVALVLPTSSLLPGDGYAEYVKPFRTVEDIHVVGAIIAYLARFLGSIHGEEARVERLVALLLSLAHLARRPPLDPAVHRALAGTLDLLRASLEGIEAALAHHPARAAADAIVRDLALLGIAETVRRARLESARAAFGSG